MTESIPASVRPVTPLRLTNDGGFTGYASVFGVRDLQGDVVVRGAFTRTLNEAQQSRHPPVMLWMHDPHTPIGVWDVLAEDDHGLAVRGRLALEAQQGREAFALLKMGALSGLSIGYRPVKGRVIAGDSGKSVRKKRTTLLTEVALLEISLVTFPANTAARVTGTG